MLILKDQFKVADPDKQRIRTLNSVLNNRVSGKFTQAECSEIHQLWDKYPLDAWCDNTFAEGVINSEVKQFKGMTQRREHAKLNMLNELTRLPARPSLDYIYGNLLVREAFRRIISAAYTYKR